MGKTLNQFNCTWLSWLNRLVCRVMFRVTGERSSPLPDKGPVLLVCDHSSLGDPLVLLATAGRHISFLMAHEIYASCFQWAYEAMDTIPVRRGRQDINAVRGMLQRLRQNQVVGLFPEGGLDNFRMEEGRPGIGYLALKTGAPIVPASVVWAKERSVTSIVRTLLIPCRVMVRYGKPLTFQKELKPDRDQIERVTSQVMSEIKRLREDIMVNAGK
ncbi:MAG: 1-acyl-sn-glycerol-3-phosphate acyltransferase [Nitrospirales bacterium]|nr:MAG: 1-acyl-sn-glycerol-3-phosphate acyltransferase [Nitrospirales bacterium]